MCQKRWVASGINRRERRRFEYLHHLNFQISHHIFITPMQALAATKIQIFFIQKYSVRFIRFISHERLEIDLTEFSFLSRVDQLEQFGLGNAHKFSTWRLSIFSWPINKIAEVCAFRTALDIAGPMLISC